MEQSLWFAEAVERMKEELFSPSADLFALLPVSAYETGWVAMVPDPDDPTRPMFPEYLDWVLRSQNSMGFWVDDDHVHEQQYWSSADLMATLACLLALKTWEATGFSHKISKGLKFLRENMEKELMKMRKSRDQGGDVLLRRFSWFIDDEEMLSYMKDNYALFSSPMLSIYKASHIAFLEDYELDKARVFSQQILQMAIISMKSQNETNFSATSTKFEQEIEHELGLKWLARMDHLEHRFYIERGGIYHFWTGKNAPCRILQNNDLLQLGIDNFMMRQSVYRKELNELHRWSKDNGLSMMGFGREKTTYCYFAMASSTCLPLDTDSRKEATKCAILITIADDFFDEKGSLHELSILTDAVQRWEKECLTSHSKVIFAALDNIVHDISLKSFQRHGHDVKQILRDAWGEIFKSWLKEAEWSKSPHHPSIDQYIEIAKTSIAVQMIILPACYLTNSTIVLEESYWDLSNTMITKSLMVSCRLLNDLESYEKEAKVGKPNIVLLYLKENPKANIDDAIAFVRKILEKKKKELIQLVMSRDSTGSQMPREWKDLHLSFLKVFQMFFNSTNVFDSPTMLLNSIDKALYEPLLREITCQYEIS